MVRWEITNRWFDFSELWLAKLVKKYKKEEWNDKVFNRIDEIIK